MSEIVAAYQVSTFLTPTNSTVADADVVRGNDNSLRAAFNSHDADAGVHFQSSTLASRPLAGTAGRKLMTTDGLRVYYDTGAAWVEAAYLPLVGGTLSGTLIAPTVEVSASLRSAINSLVLNSAGANPIDFQTAGVARWRVQNAGHFTPVATNTYDLGSTSARVRSIYVGTDIDAAGNLILGVGSAIQFGAGGAVAFTANGWVSNVSFGVQTTAAVALVINANNAAGSVQLRAGGGSAGVEVQSDGIMKVMTSGQEATGAGTPVFGSNCPATTLTAPFKWLKFRTSDGSLVYVPAWK